MRWFVGLALIVGIFRWSEAVSGQGMIGYLNSEALILVALAPLAVALMIYEWREIFVHLKTLVVSVVYSERKAKRQLAETVAAIGHAVEDGRTLDAVRIIEDVEDEAVRTAGLLYLKHYDRDRLHELFGSKAQQRLAACKRGEDFFLNLARVAPAFGLIGTIKGFISLLATMDDSASLGIGMAMALTATLYGVALSYCLYHPLAKTIGTFAQKRRQHFREAEQAILLIQDGRHTSDLGLILEQLNEERLERMAEAA